MSYVTRYDWADSAAEHIYWDVETYLRSFGKLRKLNKKRTRQKSNLFWHTKYGVGNELPLQLN
jgi:hypothetical protein